MQIIQPSAGLNAAVTSLDSLTAGAQSLIVGTSGSDFNISSLTDTHTFNIPDAGTSARGFVTTGGQTLAGAKIFSTSVAVTPADALIVNSVIVPTLIPVSVILNALSVSSALFIADTTYQVVGVRSAWGVAGGLAALLNVEKLTGTTAPGSGTAILTSGIDLTATANTVTTGALSGTVSNLQLAAGDRLGVKLGGTLTGLVGCSLTILLKRI